MVSYFKESMTRKAEAEKYGEKFSDPIGDFLTSLMPKDGKGGTGTMEEIFSKFIASLKDGDAKSYVDKAIDSVAKTVEERERRQAAAAGKAGIGSGKGKGTGEFDMAALLKDDNYLAHMKRGLMNRIHEASPENRPIIEELAKSLFDGARGSDVQQQDEKSNEAKKQDL